MRTVVLRLALFYCIVAYIVFGCTFEKFTTKCGCGNVKAKSIGRGKKLICKPIDVKDFFDTVTLPKENINIIWIDFSGNKEEELSRSMFGTDSHILEFLQGVVKLDFSSNGIWKIAADTFSPFPNLTRLNLSRNSIGNLSRDMFRGLLKLEILDLSFNKFPVIPGDAFVSLSSLKKAFLDSTDLVCNCLMRDFIVWLEKREPKLKVFGTCHLPKSGTKLRSLSSGSMECDSRNPLPKLPYFEMIPAKPQLVFEGDNIQIQCEGTNLPDSEIIWNFNGTPIGNQSSALSFSTKSNLYKSIITGWVEIKNLTINHGGSWSCTVASQHGRETRVLVLSVIRQNALYCNEEAVENIHGLFNWPLTVDGLSKSVQCQPSKHTSRSDKPPSATRYCEKGDWSIGQYEDCPFKDRVTDEVHHILNANLAENNIAKLLSDLVNRIADEPLREPMVLNFIGGLIEKTLLLLTPKNKDKIKQPLLDLASYSMKANQAMLRNAQTKAFVCDKITDAVRRYTIEMTSSASMEVGSVNIAIGGLTVKEKSQYRQEISCIVTDKPGSLQSTCKTLQMKITGLRSVIILPKSLLSNCKDRDGGYKIYYIIYRNGGLFQHAVTRSVKNDNSTSNGIISDNMVYEVGVRGCEISNLTEPIVLNFETKRPVSHYPAVWTRDGWKKDEACTAYCINRNFTQVVCYRFATVTLIHDPQSETCIKDRWSLEDFTHPAVFIGTIIMTACFACVIFSHLFCARSLKVTKESRHTILNMCIHIVIAAGMFTFGIKRIEYSKLCIVCGVVLHYTSLAVLFWITLSVRNVHHELIALARPPSLEPKPPKPMLRFYLIGCGIPIVICGITAAAKVQNYGGEEGFGEGYCWLAWETSIYAFYLPAALIALVCVIFLLRVLCTFNRQSHQFDSIRSPLARPSWQGNARMNNGNDRYQAIATEEHCQCPTRLNSSRADSPLHNHSAQLTEQSYKSQLVGVAVLFTFYLFIWVFAAISIAVPNMQYSATQNPLNFEEDYRYFYKKQKNEHTHEHTLADVFSWLYGIFAITTGVFVLLKFFACRKDCKSKCGQMFTLCGESQEDYLSGNDTRSNASYPKNDACDNMDNQNMVYLTSSNDKSSLPCGRRGKGVYTTIKTDPTTETMLNSTENAEGGGNGSLQYLDAIHKSHFINRDADFPVQMDPCVVHETGRPAKSVTSLQGSCRINPLSHNGSRSRILDSSGHKHLAHPYAHDPACSLVDSRGYPLEQGAFQYLAYHNHHLSRHQHDHGKPVKMTNLQIAHDSSMTEHSVDELAYNNMHTVPVIMQHGTQAKINNSALIDRYQKVRKALERKRARQRKLNVLREYAQDPLTSNDEGRDHDQANSKPSSVNESSPLIKSHEKDVSAGVTPQSNDVPKYRPLLLSPPSHRKQDNNHKNKSAGPNKRVKRLDSSGQPRPIRNDRRMKQSVHHSQNSTLSEREQDTTSTEKSGEKQENFPNSPSLRTAPIAVVNAPLSAISTSYESKVGQDNHGYLTLQQFQNANAFLLPNNGSTPSEIQSPNESDRESPGVDRNLQSSQTQKTETCL